MSWDAAAIAAALLAALFLRFRLGLLEVQEASPLTFRAHLVACLLWEVALLTAFVFNRLYEEDTLFPGGGQGARVTRSVIEAAAVLSMFVFLTQSFYVSRSWFALTVLFSTTFLVFERVALARFLRKERAAGRRRRPAILLGRESEEWLDWSLGDVEEFEVVAKLDLRSFEAMAVVESGNRELEDAAVVVRARDFGHDEFWRVVLLAGQVGWSVFVHSPVRSMGRDRLTLRELGGHTIVKVAPPTLTGLRGLQKRMLDVVLAAGLLVLLLPVLTLLGFAVFLSSGRDVLYRQQRVGLNGRCFEMLKFRTMRSDTGANPVASWTIKDDPRRTPLGRLLRRMSLDELPQLWNVLRGDMSVIGPRPEQPTFANDFNEQLTWYRFRHRIRPGMTGWAQAHGLRGDTSLASRVQFDNWYIENWSIFLDFKILLRTVLEVVAGKNAY